MVRSGQRHSRMVSGAGAVVLTVAGVLAVAVAITCHSVGVILAPGLSWSPSLLYGAVLWYWWAGIAYLLWQTGSARPWVLQVSGWNVALQLLLGIVATALHMATLHVTTRILADIWSRWRAAGFGSLHFFEFGRFSLDLLTYALIWSACAILYMKITAQRDAFQSLELKQQLAAAKLQALQNQLQPHFLFNTLNAITTLVRTGRQKEADAMLTHLNIILKATLARSTPEKIPLSQELQTVDNYLAIEQTRFADRLRVEIRVDPGALDGLVPCFLLQPIVENAIKHGIAHRERDGVIRTSVTKSGSQLRLQVTDNGPGLNGHSASGHGIGLKNTRERLDHFYQNQYDLTVREPTGGGCEVSITIPYERVSA